MNKLLGLTISSHLSQSDKIAKIGQIYRERNLKLVDLLADLLFKGSAACLKSFFNFAVNLKKINQNKLGLAIKELRRSLEEVSLGPPIVGGKPADGATLRQAVGLTRTLDENLGAIVEGT